MAIINNNVQNVSFLRNQTPLASREAALTKIEEAKANALDGSALLARYSGGTVGESDFFINTLVGFVAANGNDKYLTVLDVEGSEADVEELRQQMLNTFGSGVTTANTATAQLEALSGNNESTSAETSVAGAKKYADAKISELDVAAITAGEGQFIKSVSQADGKVSATTADMPSVGEIGVQGQAIVAVKQDKGTISASAGTINAEYVNVTGNTFTSTTVQGALEEVDNEYKAAIEALDYTGVMTGDGVVITNVTENNGVVSAASANVGGLKLTDYTKGSDSGSVVATDSINQAFSKLEKQIDAEKDARAAAISGLDYSDSAVAKKFVTSVSEQDGVISVSRGEVTSTDKTVVLKDGNDGGIDLAVHIDSVTLKKDENGVISVTSSALVQYEGDDNTVQIGAVQDGKRIVSSPLTIEKVTTGLDADVREAYRLVGHSGNTIGELVKIYKDSSLLSVALLHADTTADPQVLPTYNKETNTWTDIPTPTEANQALCFAYENVSGATVIAAVPVGAFINEHEFASGITWDSAAGKVKGVVDTTSETFLTVGTDGFKLSGVQDAINAAVAGLDATVNNNANSGHVAVEIVETDGKLVSVAVTEDDIASADDLAELSGKTITAITSTNGSITASISNEAGNKTADIQTDASKIKMSGFSADSASALNGIAESDSIATAFEKTNTVITENERVTAAALTDLNGRLDVVEDEYISGVSVNGHDVTIANKVAPISITAATSAVTATSTEAIVVNTDANGNITLGISSIDCGYYSE